MKAKYNVTIVKETQSSEIVDEYLAKDIITGIIQLKINPFEHMIRSEMKIDKEKISLKNKRKWFLKFKDLKLNQIRKFFLFDFAPEYILMFVSIEEFFGYIVLKIDIARNMIEFTDLLKSSENYTDTIPRIIQTTNTNNEIASNNESSSTNASTLDKIHSEEKEKSIHIGINGNEKVSHLNGGNWIGNNDFKRVESKDNNDYNSKRIGKRRKPIVIDQHYSDAVTYLNFNSKDIIVDEGPISLYSQTYPSVYNRNNENGPDYWDCNESETDSYDGKDTDF